MAEEPSSGSLPAGWVIDASVTMPWFFADEATPFTEGLLDTLGTRALWAPMLWVLECTNAHLRNRGLQRFNVRGLCKARAILLWHALAHNLKRMILYPSVGPSESAENVDLAHV